MNIHERLAGLGASAQAEGLLSVSPSDVEEVQELVHACRQSSSSVMLEVEGLPPAPVWFPSRGAGAEADLRVRIDLGGIRGVTLDDESRLVTAGAGITVSDLEGVLVDRGFTLGVHETPALPLGAWLAAGEPGPGSSRAYPGWSPVAGLEAVLLEGSVIRTGLAPRSATGPDPRSLLVGGRGRLGVITRATLRIHPVARARRQVMAFADFADAVGAVVEALGRELYPDSFGLVDWGSGEAVLTWESRGEPGRVSRLAHAVDEVCGLGGGRRIASFAEVGDDPAGGGERIGAAGPVEVRAAACANGATDEEARIAVGLGARWSRVILVRRALLNVLGGGVRVHLERALPEGAMGIACVRPEEVERARAAIRDAGGHPVGDADGDSWIAGVAGALLGGGR